MDAPLEWRMLALLMFASAAFTALAPMVYRRDPGRRKLFLMALSVVLLVTPWWSAAGLWTWPLGLEDPGLGVLAQPVPWLVVGFWWGVGALLVARTILKVARGRRGLLAMPVLNDAGVHESCRQIGRALGLTRQVSVRLGPTPCASSLGDLVLVLPSEAADWPAETRSAVLCHELAHLKRRDDRLMLMVRLLTDWYWWLPWLRRVQRRFVEAMEESCDDLASSLGPSREHYVSGLIRAARCVVDDAARPSTGRSTRKETPTAWVALLGHSHLAARVQRLLARPRPTFSHADGRWVLLWSTLAFLVVLTARPAAVPNMLPRSAELFPVMTADVSVDAQRYRPARVEVDTELEDPRTGTWRPAPGSARDPLPVYPAEALARGLAGRVVVEQRLRATRSGARAVALPIITSSDPSGVLAAAVARALTRAGGADYSAGLRVMSAHNNDLTPPPPGTSLRLRKTYRFVLGSSGRRTQGPELQEVEP